MRFTGKITRENGNGSTRKGMFFKKHQPPNLRKLQMATVLARLNASGDTPHPDKILQICLKQMKNSEKVKK